MKNILKWILSAYFFIFIFPVIFFTTLGYSDSNENPIIILIGIIFLIVFLTGTYSSIRIKKKEDFTKFKLMLPLFISFVCLFYGWDLLSFLFGRKCIFRDCNTYLLILLGSGVSVIFLYLYAKIIKRYTKEI